MLHWNIVTVITIGLFRTEISYTTGREYRHE